MLPIELPNAQNMPTLDLDDTQGILRALKEGKVAYIDGRKWVRRQSDTLSVSALLKHSVPMKNPYTFGAKSKQGASVPIYWNSSQLISRLEQGFQSFPDGWGSWGLGEKIHVENGRETASEFHVSKFAAWFGAVNLREIEAVTDGAIREESMPSIGREWSDSQNVVWMGPSWGGLHYDPWDNILLQAKNAPLKKHLGHTRSALKKHLTV